MKNGFTLVEILAVTVIVAILVLVAFPILGNLLDGVRQSLMETNAKKIIKILENDYLDGAYTESEEYVVEYKDGVPTLNEIAGMDKSITDAIIIAKEGNVKLTLFNGKYCLTKDFLETDLIATKKTKEECIVIDNTQKPTAKINLNHDGAITTSTVLNITSDSKGYFGKTITEEEWVNKSTTYLKGRHVIKLRVKDSNDIWSDWVEEEINVTYELNIKAFSRGLGNSLFYIMNDGNVYANGWNENGQLGIGNFDVTKETPQIVPSLYGASEIVTAGWHTVALMPDKTIKVAGSDYYTQLGIGGTGDENTFVPVPTLTNVKSVAAGNSFTIVALEDGTVYGFGRNETYQLGLNDQTSRSVPTLIPGVSNVKKVVTGGQFSIALLNDGTLYAWGINNNGELAMGVTGARKVPTLVPGFTDVADIVCGANHCFATKTNGDLYYWGRNNQGQLGDGTKSNVLSPTLHPYSGRLTKINTAGYFTVGVLDNKNLVSFGSNTYGQLGIGNVLEKTTPTIIPGMPIPKLISVSGYFMAVAFEDNHPHAWGNNAYGQLGIGVITPYESNPKRIIIN